MRSATFLQLFRSTWNFSPDQQRDDADPRQIDSLVDDLHHHAVPADERQPECNLNLLFQPFPWWEMNNNLTVYNTRFKEPQFGRQSGRSERWR